MKLGKQHQCLNAFYISSNVPRLMSTISVVFDLHLGSARIWGGVCTE